MPADSPVRAERPIVRPGDARGGTHARERALARLAARQHGVVARRQLLALGFGREAIARRLQTGALIALFTGVYAVGHRALRPEGHWAAGVLAAGAGGARAGASHRTAAAMHGLGADPGTFVEVSTDGRARGRPGLRVHRRRLLAADELTSVDGIACTTLALTLLDLGAVASRRVVERACDQAEILEVFDLTAIESTLSRHAGKRGAGVLRAVLAEHTIGTTATRRELEEAFLAFCRAIGLASPVVNSYVAGACEAWEADFRWPDRRLVVETDGLAYHRTPARIERDRRRDADLMAADWLVLRVTWRMVTRDRARLQQAVRRGLANARPT